PCKPQWMSDEQFAEALAFGNALPGPIATKLAGYVGYHVAGAAGALAGLAGIVAPTAVGMVALYSVFRAYRHVPWIQGMLAGVKPVVAVLLLQVTLDIARTAFPSWPFYLVAFGTAAGVFWLHAHPALLIALGLLVGALFLRG
ncbi:MAG: chromate transporter, partial [Firmicutes bacterium]|nr:chromate transporter [Bacillota bacterium]